MRSRSTWMNNSVSARRIWSPTVGPNISAYCWRVRWSGMVALRFAFGEAPGGFRFWIERPIHLVVQPVDFANAGEGDEFHLLGVARLEAHGGAGGEVETKTARGGAVEVERGVYPEKR